MFPLIGFCICVRRVVGTPPLLPPANRTYQTGKQIQVEMLGQMLSPHSSFFSYRLVATSPIRLREVRRRLYRKSQEDWHDENLTDKDIDWFMGKEGNQTALLKRSPRSASGEEKWEIRAGNVITLAELFGVGNTKVSCYDLYRTYLSLPAFIRTRVHSRPHAPQAQHVRNAKRLRFIEHGKWGLPGKPPASGCVR